MSMVTGVKKVIIFLYIFGQVLPFNTCDDSSATIKKPFNRFSPSLESDQNLIYEDQLEDEDPHYLRRSKRDDTSLDEDSEYVYEDDDEDENESSLKKDSKDEAKNVNKVTRENSKNTNDGKIADSGSSKTSDSLEKSDSSIKSMEKKETVAKVTRNDDSVHNMNLVKETLDRMKKELEESFDKKLTDLKTEMKREIDIRHKPDATASLNIKRSENVGKENANENEYAEVKDQRHFISERRTHRGLEQAHNRQKNASLRGRKRSSGHKRDAPRDKRNLSSNRENAS